MTKITKREVLGIIKAAMADNEAVVAYCDNEVAILDKKNEYRKTHPSKPTKSQEAAAALRPVVLGALTPEGKSPKDIATEVGVENFQKVTPILKALVEEGAAVKLEVKGKNLYALPTPTEE